ncbi:MAG TPA: response regulator [Polyangia bacterium]|nr:response regulator [Polyangia bacterium]
MELAALAPSIPERDGAEELKALRILYDASRAFAVCPDVEAVLQRVLHATLALLHADKGFVEMTDRADGRLRVVGQHGYPEALAARLRVLRAGGGLKGPGPHARTIVEDAASDPTLDGERPLVCEAGVRGLHSTPIYTRDVELIGVVSTQYADARRPREADLVFLDSLLDHAARFVERLWSEQAWREKERQTDALLARLDPTRHGGVAPGAQGIRRVLVVDDNEDAANMLGELLEDAGHEVRTAYTGIEALRAAETFRPDVVLLDIGLPDMDGYEVARRLRAGRARGTKIAALTGWAQPREAHRSEAAGIDVHLIKPASLQAIEDVIDSVEPRDAEDPFGLEDPLKVEEDQRRKRPSASRRVLVVDDDDDIRESLMEFLEEHGFEPLGARDGVDAFEKLGTADPQPCLIILDLMMPKMDGRTFRHKQLERAALADIPVVVISAYRDVEQNARDLHAVDWLPKPLNLPALLQVVRRACADA